MEILATIFGSKERLRIMRYAIANEKESFETSDVAKTLKLDTVLARRELRLLTKATFLKEVVFTKQIVSTSTKKVTKKKVSGFTLNKNFDHLANFKSLLLEKEEMAPVEIYEHFKKLGKIELFVLAGVFQGNPNREVDMLIAGKGLKKAKIEEKIADIERMLGAEIKYALYESDEFLYRHMMYDRFVREVMHNDHIAVVKELKL